MSLNGFVESWLSLVFCITGMSFGPKDLWLFQTNNYGPQRPQLDFFLM